MACFNVSARIKLPWRPAGILAFVIIWAGACSQAPPPPPAKIDSPKDSIDIGIQVHSFCGGTCHAYPPADSFPRRVWRGEVERGFRFFEQSGLAIEAPPIEAVVKYYEKQAPEELPVNDQRPAKPYGMKFEKITYPPPSGGEKVAISHLNIASLPANLAAAGAKKQLPSILAADMLNGQLMALRPSDATPIWKVLFRLSDPENPAQPGHPAHVEVVDLDGDGILDLLVADLGSFAPTDRRCGRVIWLRGQSDGSFTPFTLLDNVGRVADIRVADFRGTGKLDIIVAVFGLQSAGEIVLLENQTSDWSKPKFTSRKIDSRHGAIHVPVIDLNGDGKPDFIALIAQEHEMVIAFINTGNGNFTKKILYSAPHPGWGSSGIQLVDLNNDGKLDVLYTNGDILDEPYLWKPYHGVQWLENKGDLTFEHHVISPMYGVHNAVAADFGMGRKDVAAVSFLPNTKFPDRESRKADALSIFSQETDGRFERHPLATGGCDAVVCAAGDLYGCGRADVVVGNFSSPNSLNPVEIWKNLGASHTTASSTTPILPKK